MNAHPLINATLVTSNEGSARHIVILRISPTVLHAEGKTASCSLPLKGLRVSWGGANNALLFISHPHHPEITLFTRDKAVIAALEAHTTPELYQQLKALKMVASRRHLRALGAGVALMIGVWGITLAWSPTTRYLAGFVPFSWEQKIGQYLFKGLGTEMSFLNDSKTNEKLRTLSAPLLEQAKKEGFTFELHIAESEDLNAFAIPGGILVVNSQTILKAGRPEELLGVIAHEISHVTHRHTVRQVITVFGVYVVADLLLGNFLGSVAALSQGASYLLQQGFSREQEHDADVTGLHYLEAAKIDPRGMMEFFSRIRDERDKVGYIGTVERSLSFLSTHPDTDSRIAEIRARIERSGAQPPPPLPLEPFQELQADVRRLVDHSSSDKS